MGVSERRGDRFSSGPASPPPSPTRQRAAGRRGRWGWGGVVVAFAILLAIIFLLDPWALHMGNRFTPLAQWEGVGIVHASSGARDVLYLRIGLQLSTGRHPTGRSSNLEGEALLRTPQGETVRWDVSGTLRAWWSTEGRPLSIRLITKKPHLYFDLSGAFQGTQLVLDDHGSSARMLRRDGSIDARGAQHFSTAEHPWVRVTLAPGSRAELESLARGVAPR